MSLSVCLSISLLFSSLSLSPSIYRSAYLSIYPLSLSTYLSIYSIPSLSFSLLFSFCLSPILSHFVALLCLPPSFTPSLPPSSSLSHEFYSVISCLIFFLKAKKSLLRHPVHHELRIRLLTVFSPGRYSFVLPFLWGQAFSESHKGRGHVSAYVPAYRHNYACVSDVTRQNRLRWAAQVEDRDHRMLDVWEEWGMDR